MTAGRFQLKTGALLLIFKLCFYTSSQRTEPQVCGWCRGSVVNDSAVGQFCDASAGRTKGRCCLRNDSNFDGERIIGLDLSNCSLTQIEDLPGASTALIIDLSLNPIVNISDSLFQGFLDLNNLILPADIPCPGGNFSWNKVEIKDGNHLCEGQKNMCNQTGQLSANCPQNSLCAPYGPGFFECSCTDNYHGYKCLREGEFPALLVFVPLGVSTLVISSLLWVIERRKAKPV
ncbi:all-trans retinoic acid-induced differentiation factor [Thalassophryne amazonica]|uniref:all-trans retinoic acid-induced differentiation factor n=1 Tax=Thalassophryne amazonica TaxID=390379 RepID=UPI001470ADF7|nr:all-trans retinoic acid-induced differentiation factor [Thalassophryne amazonica]